MIKSDTKYPGYKTSQKEPRFHFLVLGQMTQRIGASEQFDNYYFILKDLHIYIFTYNVYIQGCIYIITISFYNFLNYKRGTGKQEIKLVWLQALKKSVDK